MSEKELDYKKLKFKSGLEIHQQIDTEKLFCKCPSILRSDEPDFIITRRLHAVAGESGEVDIAAQYQSSLKKEFVYQFYKDNNCLIELDEEPPHKINQEALKIALQISLLLNCKIIPITQIMRKTVIDGSNTSGFQRTALIGREGILATSLGNVGITNISLEEDSGKIIKDTPVSALVDGNRTHAMIVMDQLVNLAIKNNIDERHSPTGHGVILLCASGKRKPHHLHIHTAGRIALG